mgnify:CR=1 FL=1
MADLNTDVRYIKGIGEVRGKSLQKLGINTLQQLISYFPRAYEDRSKFYPIRELPLNENACCRAMIAAEPVSQRISGGRSIVKVRAVDESGILDITFFNQDYRKSSIHTGETYCIYGKAEGNLLRRQMVNPLMEKEENQQITGRIMPVYPLTKGISQLQLSRAVRQGLDECRELLDDVLPDEVRRENELCYTNFAYENIHFPASFEELAVARRRLVFEELFLLTCGLQRLRARRKDVAGPACHAVDLQPFLEKLPFPLTGDQRRAIDDAVGDMLSGRPMNRLVQGDVGSGKTMVAAACAWFAAQNGWQSALMAPTEVLARQHFETLSPLFEKLGLTCALLTGSTKAKERRELLGQLEQGEIDLCIGTHALLTEDVQYARLGLVITDEQHRFGVNQRSALGQKAESPHMMVLSATPIPRTLALIIYGDLDVSVIRELPPGRQVVDTFAVGESYRPRINAFIRKQVSEGHQVFIVCPLVGDAETIPDERKAVTAYAENLQQNVFPELRVSVLHGKMKPKEKEAVMAAFSAGESNILVSTTVIEVGVDVPNATLMLVENAELFGLSQLHQLRGRVGRGKAKSYCILLSQSTTEDGKARLKALTDTNDGFRIAEEDLKLRGPGDFFGQRQHGLPELKVADLSCDMRLLDDAQQAAKKLLADDPLLEQPEHRALKERIAELFAINAEALN